MIVPVVLFVASAFGLGAAIFLPDQTDFILLAGPMTLASLWLLLWSRLGETRRALPRLSRLPTPTRRWALWRKKPKWVVIDGSNVMHWKDGTAQIEPVQAVVAKLTSAGFAPGVVFDANAGYKLVGRYKHDHALGRLLGLPEDRVMVVNKGSPADPTILAAARDLGARIVSNDRFRDWAETHPEVAKPGHVIAGGYKDGQLWLDLG